MSYAHVLQSVLYYCITNYARSRYTRLVPAVIRILSCIALARVCIYSVMGKTEWELYYVYNGAVYKHNTDHALYPCTYIIRMYVGKGYIYIYYKESAAAAVYIRSWRDISFLGGGMRSSIYIVVFGRLKKKYGQAAEPSGRRLPIISTSFVIRTLDPGSHAPTHRRFPPAARARVWVTMLFQR